MVPRSAAPISVETLERLVLDAEHRTRSGGRWTALEAEAEVGLYLHLGLRPPGRRAACRRWNWSEREARTLLERVVPALQGRTSTIAPNRVPPLPSKVGIIDALHLMTIVRRKVGELPRQVRRCREVRGWDKDDCVQAVFLACMRKTNTPASGWNPARGSVEVWVYQVARSELANKADRKPQPQPLSVDPTEAGEPTPMAWGTNPHAAK